MSLATISEVEQYHDEPEPPECAAPTESLADRRRARQRQHAVILLEQIVKGSDKVFHLQRSCRLCRIPITFKFATEGAEVTSVCEVGGAVVGEATAAKRPQARRAAAMQALGALTLCCYTIRRKLTEKHHRLLTRADLSGDAPDSLASATSSSGRARGAAGRDGSALGAAGRDGSASGAAGRDGSAPGAAGRDGSAPGAAGRDGSVPGAAGRDGRVMEGDASEVSQEGSSSPFRINVEQALHQYGSVFRDASLCFSPEFTSEERRQIHELAAQLDLDSRSHGPKSHRCIVVSHRIQPYRLLRHLVANGWETDNHILLPPKGDPHPTDYQVENFLRDYEPPEPDKRKQAEKKERKLFKKKERNANKCLKPKPNEKPKKKEKKKKKKNKNMAKVVDNEQLKCQGQLVTVSGAANVGVMLNNAGPPTAVSANAGISEAEISTGIGRGEYGAFIIVDHSLLEKTDAARLLQFSSAICQIPVQFRFGSCDSGSVCSCIVGGSLVAEVSAWSRATAKELAAERALAALGRRCYTIRPKVRAVVEKVARADLTPESSTCEDRVGADSVGGRLLAMMGWSGGGLGRHEQGITEPVRSSGLMSGRAGLGSRQSAADKRCSDLKSSITRLLHQYSSQFRKNDLVFHSDFSKAERSEISQIAKKFRLNSRNSGKPSDRCLIVSQKVIPHTLLQYLISAGGETEKHIVVPPRDPGQIETVEL